jgi:glutaconate CoA-transferase subunit A
MAREEKVIEVAEAVERFVQDGCVLGVGGMHMHNNAMAVIREIIRQKKNIKRLVTSPSACTNADILIGAGLVEEIYCSYVGFEHLGLALNFRKFAESGQLKVRECDEAFSVYSLRGGASSLPFHPLPKGLETTSVPTLNQEDYKITKDPFTGEDVMCVRSVQPDVSIVHCQKADAYGNAIFEGRVVPNEYILQKSNRIDVPGMLVDAIVDAPFGCHPTASHKYYTYDEDHLKEYLKASKEDFSAYLDKYVYGTKTNEDYLEVIGGREKATQLMERDIPW